MDTCQTDESRLLAQRVLTVRMVAKKAGLEKVPVIIKKFNSRDETIEYEYKMQLNSRRLTDGEYFAAFLKLDEIRRSNSNVQGSSDEVIGRQLNKSDRQVCKMREIAKKADASLLEKIQNGNVSINIEPIKSLASQLYEPINLIFEPIYLMILIYLSR